MNARDEFYQVLSKDLAFYGKKSVLYQYLEEEQEKRTVRDKQTDLGKARSYQLRIRHYRKQLKNSVLSPEKYGELLLEILLWKPQFAKPCGKQEKSLYISQDPRPMLREMLNIALGQELLEGKKNLEQDIQAVYDILSMGKGAEYKSVLDRLGKEGFWQPPFTKLLRLTDAILDVAVAYDINEFFFGTAVKQQECRLEESKQKIFRKGKSGSRAERTDKSLKLLDCYCRKRGKSLFGGAGGEEPSDWECDILYHNLRESGNKEVFVPLLIDRATGCGIYLIGKAYFEENIEGGRKTYEGTEESCAYGVLFLDDDYGEGIRTGYHIVNRFGEFPDYNSARFGGDWSYENMRQEAEASMKERNGKMPEGIPELFRLYFEEQNDSELEQYQQEVRQQVADCEKELRKNASVS